MIRTRVAANRRHGFATAMAVTFLALAGIVVAVMGTYFVSEVRRTRDTATDAQLRQLLIAGQSQARGILGASTTAVTTATIPPELTADGYVLVLRPIASKVQSTRTVEVDASVGKRRLSQTLTYERSGGGWVLESAVLGE